jgi:hypothetical protein
LFVEFIRDMIRKGSRRIKIPPGAFILAFSAIFFSSLPPFLQKVGIRLLDEQDTMGHPTMQKYFNMQKMSS